MNTSANANPVPYAGLTPAVVLDALAAAGFEGDGRLVQLNSFENRVFQVMLEDGQVVIAKFYRPGRWSDEQIAEEHAFAFEAAAAEIPVVAPLRLNSSPHENFDLCAAAPQSLARWSSGPLNDAKVNGWRFGVWPRRAGRAPELEDPQVLRRLGTCLGRLHALGSRQPFAHRHTLRPVRDAETALAQLAEDQALPLDQQAVWQDAGARALDFIGHACTDNGLAAHINTTRLHGDCHPGNLLWRDDSPNLVDLDDACNGPAVQDLWMLLSGEPDAARAQLRAMLEGYDSVHRFDRRELRWMEALRLLRMLRHNAWISRRWADPAFPAAYPDYGSSSYWAQQVAQLREQTAVAQERANTPLY